MYWLWRIEHVDQWFKQRFRKHPYSYAALLLIIVAIVAQTATTLIKSQTSPAQIVVKNSAQPELVGSIAPAPSSNASSASTPAQTPPKKPNKRVAQATPPSTSAQPSLAAPAVPPAGSQSAQSGEPRQEYQQWVEGGGVGIQGSTINAPITVNPTAHDPNKIYVNGASVGLLCGQVLQNKVFPDKLRFTCMEGHLEPAIELEELQYASTERSIAHFAQ